MKHFSYKSILEEARMKKIDKNRFGPWAIVTGASSGIGKEFARQIAGSGLHVILVARRQSALEELGRELTKEYGVQYRTVAVDLSDEGFLERMIAVTRDLDIGLIISNAGAVVYGDFLTTERASLYRSLHLNATAHLNLIHHYGQHLAKRGRGGVILVSSTAGLQGTPYMADYAAAKAYVSSLGEALHVEFEKLGVNVTVLVPGPTDTAMLVDSGTKPGDLPMKVMTAAECATEGLIALTANQPSHITGTMMRTMMSVIPRSVRSKMLGSMVAKGFERLKARTAQADS
jgi:short-subunit dehydrogenase